jgi:phosphatidylserine synthase
MVSRLPTWSMKSAKMPEAPIAATIALVAAACLFVAPWATLSVAGVLYAATIPITAIACHRLRRAAEEAGAADRAEGPERDAPIGSAMP